MTTTKKIKGLLVVSLIMLAALLTITFATIMKAVSEHEPLYTFVISVGAGILCERFVVMFTTMWNLRDK